MRVVLLGTGGYHPNERRHTACVMFPELGLIFDAGSSFFRVPEYLQTDEVDIFLSHAHLDHICGLTFFLHPLLSGKVKQARLHGLPRTFSAIQNHLFAEDVFPLMPEYEYIPLEPKVAVPQGGIVRHCSMQHPGGSTGFRVDWSGCSFAYITDSFINGSYTEFIRGVDLLVHECYFPDDMVEWCEKTGHSHTTLVANLAKEANVGQLLLTHIDPNRTDDDPIDIKVAKKIFPNTQVAEDGMEINF